MGIIFYILRLVYIFGAWNFSRQYIEEGKKKKTCYIGMVLSGLTVLTSVFDIKGCFETMGIIDGLDRSLDPYVSSPYTPDGVYGLAVLLMLVSVAVFFTSIFATRKYYFAIKAKREGI